MVMIRDLDLADILKSLGELRGPWAKSEFLV